MNPIKKLLDLLEPQFTGKGRYSKLEPLFDATKTFFFLPSPATRVMPFIRDSLDLKRYMSFVILSLMPVLFFGIWNTGYQAGLGQGEPFGLKDSFLTGAAYVVPIIIGGMRPPHAHPTDVLNVPGPIQGTDEHTAHRNSIIVQPDIYSGLIPTPTPIPRHQRQHIVTIPIQ